MSVYGFDHALAADRSMRSIDADGHMKVGESRISKANVCPYMGSEIPDWQALQLDPKKIYYLYRDPLELAKGASTFDGKPLLIKHVAISGEVPHQSLWVGTLGKTTFESPYLVTRPLMVLTAEAQRLIDSNKQRELSAGYRYRADMTPGVTNTGARYDGVMREIEANHCAIVSEGRVGRDVHVADELPRGLKMLRSNIVRQVEASLAAAGIRISNQERLALDARLAADGVGEPEDTGQRRSESVISLDASEKSEAERKALDLKRRRYGKDAELTDEEKAKCYDDALEGKAKAFLSRDKSARDTEMAALGNSPDRNQPDAAGMRFVRTRAQQARSDHRRDFDTPGRDQRSFDQARDAAFRRSDDDYSSCVLRSQFGYAFPTTGDGHSVIDEMFGARRDREAASEGADSTIALDGADLCDIDALFSSPVQVES